MFETLVNEKGRIGRLTYLVGLSCVVILQCLFTTLAKHLPGLSYLFAALATALIVPTVALGLRRAHDLGKSGMWFGAWMLGSVLGILFYFAAKSLIDQGNPGASLMFSLPSIILQFGSFYQIVIKFVFFPGEPRINQYGAPEGFSNGGRSTSDPWSRPDESVSATRVTRVVQQRDDVLTPPASEPKRPTMRQQGFGRRGIA